MVYQFDPETELIFSYLAKHSTNENQVFMVGGMVRDILLNRPVHDIDLSYCGNVKEFGKKVADDLGAAFFMLNEKFQTARIIYKSSVGSKRWIDIVATRDNDIQLDLSLRDFTVNAMAIEINKRMSLIDPMSGAKDLNNKILKLCNPDGLNDDPIRILRAVRLSVQFGWKIASDTILAIKESAHKLRRISPERKRDELFRIFNLQNPALAFQVLEYLNLIKYCLETIDLQLVNKENSTGNLSVSIENSISMIQKYLHFERLMFEPNRSEGAENIHQAELIIRFKIYHSSLHNYLQSNLHEDRPIRSLLILGILILNSIKHPDFQDFSDVNKGKTNEEFCDLAEKAARALILTNAEVKWLIEFSNNINHLMNSHNLEQSLTPEFAYDFFNRSNLSGIAICIYTIINSFDRGMKSQEKQIWTNNLTTSRFLMDAYFNHFDEWIKPPLHLNGHDIMKILGIKDGKNIGYWLNRITIQTVKGEIKNHNEAVRFLLKEAKKLL